MMIRIGAELPSNLKHDLTNLLTGYVDVFAWKPKDMTWIPTDIIKHRLNINPSFP